MRSKMLLSCPHSRTSVVSSLSAIPMLTAPATRCSGIAVLPISGSGSGSGLPVLESCRHSRRYGNWLLAAWRNRRRLSLVWDPFY